MDMTESLTKTRDKLARVLAIYTPMRGAEGYVAAMGAALGEFEAAVREDERALLVKATAPPTEFPTDKVFVNKTDFADEYRENPVEQPADAAGDVSVPSANVQADYPPLTSDHVVEEIPGVNAPAARNGRRRGG